MKRPSQSDQNSPPMAEIDGLHDHRQEHQNDEDASKPTSSNGLFLMQHRISVGTRDNVRGSTEDASVVSRCAKPPTGDITTCRSQVLVILEPMTTYALTG